MLGSSVRRPLAGISGLALAVFASALLMAFAVLAPLGASQAFAAELEAQAVAAGSADFDSPVNDLMKHSFAKAAKGSVTWDAATKTVTMRNATINLDKQASSKIVYGVFVDGNEEEPTPTVTLKLVGSNTIKGTNEGLRYGVCVDNANLKIEGSGSLSVQLPEKAVGVYCSEDLEAASATIKTTGCRNGVYCDDTFTLAGATLSLKNAGKTAFVANDDAVFRKGSITVSGAKGGYGIFAKDDLTLSGGKVVVSGVSAYSAVSVDGAVKATAGTMTLSDSMVGISCGKAFALNGAKAKVSIDSMESTGLVSKGFTSKAGFLSVKGCSSGIYSENAAAQIAGGTVSVSSTKNAAVTANGLNVKSGSLIVTGCANGVNSTGAVKIAGGKVSISKASKMGINVQGGKLQITGGSVSAKCDAANKYALYSNKGASIKPACLKAVKGALSKGASFKVDGITYQVNNDSSNVTLKTFAPSKKASKVLVDAVSFGGWKYAVNSIGAGAFNTKQGKAVTSITLGQRVATIGAKAFSNTKKLTKLTVKRASTYKWSLNKKAFAQCGKGGGKNLTVSCAYGADAKKLKKLFVKAGMSSKATFK